ncbi:MAG TPA: hypothetical protein DCE44_22660, partial [Verrucomicrobiales bacterium]|nr:hypothetical protein [Verrucomicrobiales bacterium]
ALLTPEQQTAYAELQREERSNSARLMANSELLQMQSALGLSQEQQDQAFRALYAESERQFGNDPSDGFGQAPNFREMTERKLKALKGVLTPEQYERYRSMQEQQLKMVETLMPKGGKPGDVAIPQINILPVTPP